MDTVSGVPCPVLDSPDLDSPVLSWTRLTWTRLSCPGAVPWSSEGAASEWKWTALRRWSGHGFRVGLRRIRSSTLSRVDDPYGTDIFTRDPHRDGPGARRPRSREVHVEEGMVLEDVSTGFVGAVVGVEKSGGMHVVEMEDSRGRRRAFPLG